MYSRSEAEKSRQQANHWMHTIYYFIFILVSWCVCGLCAHQQSIHFTAAHYRSNVEIDQTAYARRKFIYIEMCSAHFFG